MRTLRILSVLILVSFLPSVARSAEDKKNNDPNPIASALELPFRATSEALNTVFDLGRVTVTGKRLDSPFGEFVAGKASSTQVIDRAEIELSGARNLPEALEESPGVVLTDLVGNGEEPTLDYRGFNEGQDFLFLLDGVRMNEPKSNNVNFPLIPLGLADRIEISRGGESFLYGEGAMGGVANIVGLFPQEDGFHSRVKSLAGSFDEWGESFDASAKRDGCGVFMAGDAYHTRGFRENSSVEKESFYTKFVWDVTDKARLGLTYLYADAHLDRSGSIRETLIRTMGREATERPRNFSELESNLGIVDFRFEPVESVAVSSNLFRRTSQELAVANFATFDTDDNELDLGVDTWGFAIQADHSKEMFWGLTEGLLVGVDYANNSIDEEDYNRSKSTLRRLAMVVDSDSEKETAGVFAKASLSWNERLGGYVGVRYDDVHFTNTDRINAGNDVPGEVSKVSHSVGASYQITAPLAWTTSYSHSFRAPTLADLYANPLFGGNPALKPEEGNDYETGLRWSDGRLLAKQTFFLSRRSDEIGFDPNLTDATHLFGQNANFGKTQRTGSETFIETKIRPWLRWRASHTYTEAVFKSNSATAEISGDHIPMVPRNRLTSGVLIQPNAAWDLDFSAIAVSKQILTNDLTNDRNGRRLPGYTVFNFRTVYRMKGWEFSFQVKNLLDERYESGGSVGAPFSVFNADHTVEDNFFVPAPGRSYGGAVSYSW